MSQHSFTIGLTHRGTYETHPAPWNVLADARLRHSAGACPVLQPLPENGQTLPYPELLTRIRAQAGRRTTPSISIKWKDLEDMADGIQQTTRFLSKATEVPEKNKKTLKEVTDDFSK